MRTTFPRGWPSLLLTAAVLLLTAPAGAQGGSEELEPSDGLFSYVGPPEPYRLAVRAALLGQDAYRKCQLVALSSIQSEWAVYVTREDESSPRLVSRRMRKHLWAEMSKIISDEGRETSYPTDSLAQTAALKHLSIEVDTAITHLSQATADLLDEVWWRMLSRVRYLELHYYRLDGVTYHISHWSKGKGFRSGQAWSPEDGSRPAALVQLAEEMRALAETPTKAAEEQLAYHARQLLAQLK